MKKLGNYIKIAFLLVIGATFSTQINAALDFLIDVDYNALGDQIAAVVSTVVDALVAAYDYVVGLFADAPAAVEAVADGSGTVSSTIN